MEAARMRAQRPGAAQGTVDIEHDETNRKAVAGVARMKIARVVGAFFDGFAALFRCQLGRRTRVRISLGERSGRHLRSRRHGQSADTADKARSLRCGRRSATSSLTEGARERHSPAVPTVGAARDTARSIRRSGTNHNRMLAKTPSLNASIRPFPITVPCAR